MPEGPITILVSEGNSVVRRGLVDLLGLVGGVRVIGEAGNGWETIALFRQFSPAITLIDLQLPQLSAVEAIRLIRNESPEAPRYPRCGGCTECITQILTSM